MIDGNDGLLSDISVLDLSQGVAGPFCTKLLGGCGAEVIKIEPPDTGDPSRLARPFLDTNSTLENSALFSYLNTSKKSVTLDPAVSQQAKVLAGMAQTCDVLVESFAPGHLESLGLGYADLSRINPELIHVSVTAFGQTGPYRTYKGSDIIAQAVGMLMYSIGLPDKEPLKVGGESGLYTVGVSAFSATMLAIYARDTQGFGQHVDISAMEVMTVAQLYASIYTQFGQAPIRRETNLVRAQDGWISPGLETGVQESTWPKVCELIGKPELIEDPRFATQEARRGNQKDLLSVISEWAMSKPKEEIYHTLQALRTITGYVATVEDLLKSQQFIYREFFQSIPDPLFGDIVQPGAPFRIDDSAWKLFPAPRLGQHNEEILCQRLGYSLDELSLRPNKEGT